VVARRLADLVVALHLAYLVFIPTGGWLVRRWPRLLLVHLGALLAALAAVTIGFDCPLTTWEQHLRRSGGQQPYRGGFIDHYLTGRLFPHGFDRGIQIAMAVVCLLPYLQFVARRSPRGSDCRGGSNDHSAQSGVSPADPIR